VCESKQKKYLNQIKYLDNVVDKTIMKFLITFFIALFFAAPVWAVDVSMGAGGNLVFEPNEITISAGETVHFINEALPPHNIIVEARPDLSREALLFAPGESQDVVFADVGDYNFFCGPHQGAGMTGVIHVE
jgi:plastocyanin